MNKISYRLSSIPYVSIADQRTATFSYMHPERTIPFHVLLYVLKGTVPIVEDNTEYIVEQGSLFFMKKNVHHWGEKMIKIGTSFIYVHFFMPEADETDMPFEEFSPQFTPKRRRIRPADYENSIITLPKMLNNLGGSTIEYKLQELASYYNSDDVFKKLHLNAMFAEILADCYQFQFSKLYTTFDMRVEEIMSYLRLHRDEPFHSSGVEEHMRLNYKYLEEIFKKKTGMTIQQYHTDLRMQEAARLLRSTLHSVSEISSMVGYQDPLYFSNVFKKATGYSPRAYRNNIGIIIMD